MTAACGGAPRTAPAPATLEHATVAAPRPLRFGMIRDVDGDGFDDYVGFDEVRRGGPHGVEDASWQPGDRLLMPAGDVDGDGRADVIAIEMTCTGDDCGFAQLELFRGKARGLGDVPDQILATPGGERPIFVAAAGDLDGDGRADLAYETDRGVAIALGDVSGLRTTRLDLEDVRVAVAAGDVEGDGDGDLLAVTHNGRLEVILGGDGFPARRELVDPDGAGVSSLAAGDFDGDGHREIAVSRRDGCDPEPTRVAITIYSLGDEQERELGAGSGGSAFVTSVGDVDGDGLDDLLTGLTCSEILGGVCYSGPYELFAGGPDGLSAEPIWTAPARSILDFDDIDRALGDVDGDGRADFMAGGEIVLGATIGR